MQSGNLNNDMIKVHMRALADFEEICSDPFLEETRAHVSSAIAKNHKESRKSESDRKFVQDSLSRNTFNPEDFKDIKIEFRQSDIDLLSVEWVNEWHQKKQSEAKLSPEDEERRSFISDSLNAAPVGEKTSRPKIVPLRRIAYMAAAALIGIMIFFAALAPSSSPERLFSKYYESFPAMTSVTRGNSSVQANFEQAIDYYKASMYPEAAASFRQALNENSASLFYLGLSELENNNTDQAISALEQAAQQQDAYFKETRWYLGLAWLKKGNKPESAKYFGALAGTEGFYSKRAAEILRRLK